MRFNTFINRTCSYSVRQLALEIAAVGKFADRDQLIYISSERGRSKDESHLCDSLRIVANSCAL